MKKILRRILLGFLVLVLAFGLFVACGDDSSEKTEAVVDDYVNEDYVSPTSVKSVSLTEDGTLSMKRAKRSGNGSGCASDTWTIFVYMCGSDLESDDGSATDDMEEMLDAGTGENIKYIVQTGGANEWWSDDIDASKIQRFEICQNECTLVDEEPLADMGDADTLADFLSWGLETYPAEHTALIFWDHGGGSISGVCFDELYDYDSLSLTDIDNALFSVFDLMGHNFEFIGFDACLMGTVESANVLASYADYMIASQETVPGYGWNYRRLGYYIKYHTDASGAEIGKNFVDEYFDELDFLSYGPNLTMSVIDLSKIDAFVEAFNTYAYNLYNATEDAATLSGVMRSALKVDNFGGNNDAVGYTNMVDLKGLIQAGSSYADGADAALAALSEAVVYTKSGSSHAAAGGLSVYYPLEVQGSTELGTFGDVAISPYYLAYVDRSAYGAANAGDTSDYDVSKVIDIWSETNNAGSAESDNESYWDDYGDYEQTGESSLITFDEEPALTSDGSYSFTLSAEGVVNASDIQALVYQVSSDGEDIIELGYSTDFYADIHDDGSLTVSDSFDGYWFSLPDGQNLAVYVMTETDDAVVFSSPITLNGEETNLIFTYNSDNTVEINGTWDGIHSNGMAAREYKELHTGDKIIPVYDAINIETVDTLNYVGQEYTWEEDANVNFGLLADADYLYCFIIDDVYGDYYQTDSVMFGIENGQPYYYYE